MGYQLDPACRDPGESSQATVNKAVMWSVLLGIVGKGFHIDRLKS